jgi:cellobiose epimerase
MLSASQRTEMSSAAMNEPRDLIQLAHSMRAHLFEHIMPFWCGPALDDQQGGWMAWLSNDLTPDRTKPKGLIVNSRILWTFSAVHRYRSAGIYREMADRALDVVLNHFWDSKFGGAYWQLDGDGHILDDSKKTYGQAFYIYALVESYQAFGAASALARAKELFNLIEEHTHDSTNGGYLEVRRRDWSEAADTRLSEKDQNEKKSMNNHLHVLEAYTNLYRVWKSPAVEQRLRELIDLFLHRILDPRTNHLHHFFDEAWNIRSDSYTFGHDIEAAWLLCEAAEVLGDSPMLDSVRTVAVQISDAVCREAISPDGGLCYEGRAGRIIDSRKECWPQVEAIVGFINAFQISHDSKYIQAAQRLWNYSEQNLVDRVHGEWFWRINDDGQPDSTLPKVSEWKGPYHVSRACLESTHRLESIATGA